MGKWFDQYCPIAHALSLVGERWALLDRARADARARGATPTWRPACRGSARTSSPRGCATSRGRRRAPPQAAAAAASTVYELTAYGARARGGAARAGRWGARTLGCRAARTTSSPTGASTRFPALFYPERARGRDRDVRRSASTTTSSPSRIVDGRWTRSSAPPTTPTSTSRRTWRRSSRSPPATCRRRGARAGPLRCEGDATRSRSRAASASSPSRRGWTRSRPRRPRPPSDARARLTVRSAVAPAREMGMARPVALIGAPTSAGAFAPGQEDGPAALRAAGLADALRASGREVRDKGDTPRFRWRADHDEPRAMNAEAVVRGVREVAAVSRRRCAPASSRSCSAATAPWAWAPWRAPWRRATEPRLVYLDLHADLNTPVLGARRRAGLDGRRAPARRPRRRRALRRRGPAAAAAARRRRRAARPRPGAEHGRRARARRRARAVGDRRRRPGGRPARRPRGARASAATAGGRPFLVHFDVDVIDFSDVPLSENTGRGIGVPFDTRSPPWRRSPPTTRRSRSP